MILLRDAVFPPVVLRSVAEAGACSKLDYGMIRAAAFVAVAVSIGFYQLVRLIETRVLGDFSGDDEC